MGIYVGAAPRGSRPLGQSPPHERTREQQIEQHCWQEAVEEVESWFSGAHYQWAPLEYNPRWRFNGRHMVRLR